MRGRGAPAPAREAFNVESFRDQVVVSFRSKAGTAADVKVVDLVTFIEHPEWGNFPLRPRQRLIAKIVHNAVVDATRPKDIQRLPWEKVRLDARIDADEQAFDEDGNPRRGWWELHVEEHGKGPDLANLDHCTEYREDGSVWYDEEADFSKLKTRENPYANAIVRISGDPASPLLIILVLGRGGSKTTLAAFFSAWQTHRLQASKDPHEFYGLKARKSLKIQNVATAEAQANEFFQAYKTTITTIPWFAGHYHEPLLEKSMKFGKLPGSAEEPQIIAEMKSSSSRAGRGGDTVVYIHDEIAHAEKGGENKVGARSDRSLWRAYHSAVKTRGKSKGIEGLLSSPAEQDGVLWEEFTKAEQGITPNVVLVQIATWEMIPGHTRANYDPEYADDPDGAEMEFGAQFYSGSANLIPKAQEKLDVAVENGRKLGLIRRRSSFFDDERLLDNGRYRKDKALIWDYAGHLDTSKGGNRLAFALTHMEGPYTILDYVKGWDTLPHFTKELEPFLKGINDRFKMRQLSFDQYMSLQLIQDLTDYGINCIEKTFTAEYNDAIARNLMAILAPSAVTLAIYPTTYEGPVPKRGSGWDTGDDEEAIWMWLARQEIAAAKKVMRAKVGSADKRFLIAGVAPTTGPIIHDDILDAISAAAFEARQMVMGSGRLDFLSPVDANEWAKNYIQEQVKEREASGEYSGEPVRCSFCGHGWNDLTGLPLTTCPGCGQYTQIRLM